MRLHSYSKEAMQLVGEDESEEVLVVQHSNTVVEPLAVVVKVSYAAIAISTVFASLVHMTVAYLALEIEVCVYYDHSTIKLIFIISQSSNQEPKTTTYPLALSCFSLRTLGSVGSMTLHFTPMTAITKSMAILAIGRTTLILGISSTY